MKTMLLCDKCKKNEVEIYNDNGNCCIPCWYEMTDPKAQMNNLNTARAPYIKHNSAEAVVDKSNALLTNQSLIC